MSSYRYYFLDSADHIADFHLIERETDSQAQVRARSRMTCGAGSHLGVKGQTPMVECSGQRQSASAASCVNAKGGFWFTTYWGTMTAGKFCELLRKLMNGRRQPLFLVLDSPPAHKAKLVRKYVASTKGRLEPHFLPRYAPELNPDELVWNHLKRNGTAKRPLAEGENLCHRVAADLLAIKRRPLFPPGAKCARSVQFSISDHAEEVAARCAGWGSAGESDHCGEDRSLERAAQG